MKELKLILKQILQCTKYELISHEIPNKGVLTFDIKVLSVLKVTLFPCLHHYDDEDDDDDGGDDYMDDGDHPYYYKDDSANLSATIVSIKLSFKIHNSQPLHAKCILDYMKSKSRGPLGSNFKLEALRAS